MLDKPVLKRGRKKPGKLPPLTAIQDQVMGHIMNSIAFENYGDCCSAESIAQIVGRTPQGMARMLKKLEEMGYVTIEGETYPWVYPTVAALRHQDKQLSKAQADNILKRIKG